LRVLVRIARIPAEKFSAPCGTHRGIGKFLANRIDEPFAVGIFRGFGEPETVLSGGKAFRIVWRAADGHCRPRAAPFLVFEARLAQANRVVEFCEEAARVLDKVNRRALMRGKTMAVHIEIILFCLTAKDRVVFDNEHASIWARLPQKE